MSHDGLETTEKTPAWRLALWCVLTLFGLWFAVAEVWRPNASDVAPTPPDLLAAEVMCSAEGDKALTLAQQRLRRAQLRWERGVFDRAASILALADARIAKACFERAAEREAATVTAEFVERVEGSIMRDYRQLQLRLRVAMQRRDIEAAHDAIDGLRALVGPAAVAYVRWLDGVERALRAGGDV